MNSYAYNNYLCLHGILGMKWGVRRYQNEDGSLTEEGRKHYYKSDGNPTRAGKRYEKQIAKQQRALDKKEIAQIKKDRKEAMKKRSLMSEEELDNRIRRLQKEKQLRELTQNEISRGQKFADETLVQTGKQSVQKIAVEGVAAAAGAAVAVAVKVYLESKGIATKMPN